MLLNFKLSPHLPHPSPRSPLTTHHKKIRTGLSVFGANAIMDTGQPKKVRDALAGNETFKTKLTVKNSDIIVANFYFLHAVNHTLMLSPNNIWPVIVIFHTHNRIILFLIFASRQINMLQGFFSLLFYTIRKVWRISLFVNYSRGKWSKIQSHIELCISVISLNFLTVYCTVIVVLIDKQYPDCQCISSSQQN